MTCRMSPSPMYCDPNWRHTIAESMAMPDSSPMTFTHREAVSVDLSKDCCVCGSSSEGGTRRVASERGGRSVAIMVATAGHWADRPPDGSLEQDVPGLQPPWVLDD